MSKSPWSKAVLFSSADMEWETPPHIFDALDDEFTFELDAAACPRTTKCSFWFDKTDDALVQDWTSPTSYGQTCIDNPMWLGCPWVTVWCNPPYGRDVGKWVEKAFRESQKGLTVVMLLMASTDTAWWHDYVSKAAQVRLIRGRLAFTRAKDGHSGPAPKGSAVVVFTPWSSGPAQYVLWSP